MPAPPPLHSASQRVQSLPRALGALVFLLEGWSSCFLVTIEDCPGISSPVSHSQVASAVSHFIRLCREDHWRDEVNRMASAHVYEEGSVRSRASLQVHKDLVDDLLSDSVEALKAELRR